LGLLLLLLQGAFVDIADVYGAHSWAASLQESFSLWNASVGAACAAARAPTGDAWRCLLPEVAYAASAAPRFFVVQSLVDPTGAGIVIRLPCSFAAGKCNSSMLAELERYSGAVAAAIEGAQAGARAGDGRFLTTCAQHEETCADSDWGAITIGGETMGEAMFAGNVVMKGYLKNKKATDEAFAGGWFHSGDLGVRHPDGYIQLKDRSKDIIISGGENISSIEVEDALFKHPAVQAAAVVARPDEKWGETPCAFVELKPGKSATADELIAWCREYLAGYKIPRTIVFEDLPKTSTGKVQKFVLRERAKGM
jgi:acyl-CoA synthetase (AMP-forming)/AMP-acid ligase II